MEHYQVPSTQGGQFTIIGLPDSCPHCHRNITPSPLHSYRYPLGLAVFMSCPNGDCRESFIGYYNSTSAGNVFEVGEEVSFGTPEVREFDDHIHRVSPSFKDLFNQSFFAEQHGLCEICGVGYRKALEFLIKDYCIKKSPTKKDEIENSSLSQVIRKHITDPRIQSVAERAVWLGNDETHYVRKWEGKDLSHLKMLIDLTVHWIVTQELTEAFIEEMPKTIR